MAQALRIGATDIHVSVSVGVAKFGGDVKGDSETAEQLLERADAAMYAAKGAGRGQVCAL